MKITRVHLSHPVRVRGQSSASDLSAGGIRGASASFRFELGDVAGFPGVRCIHQSGEFWVPLTQVLRLEHEDELAEPVAEPVAEPASLDDHTVAELREMAKGKVEGYSTMKKDELVQALAEVLGR